MGMLRKEMPMRSSLFTSLPKWQSCCIYLIFCAFLGNVIPAQASSCSQAHADWVGGASSVVAMQTPTNDDEPKTRGGGIGGTGAPMPSSVTQESVRVRGMESSANEHGIDPSADPLLSVLPASVVVVGKAETFPELCVSGVQIQFTEQTPVILSGGRAHLSDIEDGILLKVSGYFRNGRLQPTEIELLNTTTPPATVTLSDAVVHLYLTLDATTHMENSALLAYGFAIETDKVLATSADKPLTDTIVHLQKSQGYQTTWKLVDRLPRMTQ